MTTVAVLLSAAWIGGIPNTPAETDFSAFFADRPAPMVRKTFVVADGTKGTLRYASPGLCDVYVNGTRLTSTSLTPWTDFNFRVLEDEYDLSPYLYEGENEVVFVLGDGWWNPLPMRMWGTLNLREHVPHGDPCVRATIALAYPDGERFVIDTDASWEVGESAVLRNNIYLGEKVDARRPLRFTAKAREVVGPKGPVVPRDGLPRVVVYKSWPARRVWQVGRKWVVDFGQNFAGNARMMLRGLEPGAAVTALYGETLGHDGAVNGLTTVAGQMKDASLAPHGIAWQRDTFVAGFGKEQVWEPRLTFHAFRYLELDGLAEPPGPEDFTALAYSADVRENASFVCSNEKVNRLFDVCRNTFRANLRSVQSDCPGRERFGYGGDLAATAESFVMNYDMSKFYRKVLRDRLEGAGDCNGVFPYITPRVTARPTLGLFAMGWVVDVPIVTDLLVRHYGDTEILGEVYPALVRFLDWCDATFTPETVPPCRFGDHEALEKTENSITALCHYHQFLKLTAKFARRLGKTDDVRRFEKTAEALEKEFQKLTAYVPNPGYVGHGRQGDQSFALYHGMLRPDEVAGAYELLRKDVVAHQFQISTGFFATQYLLEVLTSHGDAELAGRVLAHEGFPGWFHMLDRGATTLWETWAETDDVYSQDHPMFGSCAAWILRTILGIRIPDDAVGCDKVEIAPQAVAGITFASGHYDTPKGRISVSWKLVDGKMQVTRQVPPGVSVVP